MRNPFQRIRDRRRLARLERAGLVKRRRQMSRREPRAFLAADLPKPAGDVSIVEALLEERREGR